MRKPTGKRLRFSVRGMMIAVAAVVLVPILGLRVYHRVIPSGAPFLPFLKESVKGPTLTSPGGERAVTVYFHDEGAAHRGHYWRWLVADDGLLGRRVVAEGYNIPEVRRGESRLAFRWFDERMFQVAFRAGPNATGSQLREPVIKLR